MTGRILCASARPGALGHAAAGNVPRCRLAGRSLRAARARPAARPAWHRRSCGWTSANRAAVIQLAARRRPGPACAQLRRIRVGDKTRLPLVYVAIEAAEAVRRDADVSRQPLQLRRPAMPAVIDEATPMQPTSRKGRTARPDGAARCARRRARHAATHHPRAPATFRRRARLVVRPRDHQGSSVQRPRHLSRPVRRRARMGLRCRTSPRPWCGWQRSARRCRRSRPSDFRPRRSPARELAAAIAGGARRAPWHAKRMRWWLVRIVRPACFAMGRELAEIAYSVGACRTAFSATGCEARDRRSAAHAARPGGGRRAARRLGVQLRQRK